MKWLVWRLLCWCPARWFNTRPVRWLRRRHALTVDDLAKMIERHEGMDDEATT